MFKTIDYILVGLVLATGAATYLIKFGSEIENSNIARLEREISNEKEAINILRANWALLTSPSRVQALVGKHSEELGLENLDPEQIISIEDIPMRPLQAPETRAAENAVQAPAADAIITGSTQPGESKQ